MTSSTSSSKAAITRILGGALTTAALLVGWQAAVVPALPEVQRRVDTDRGGIWWTKDWKGPFYANEFPDAAKVIFAGDSRVHAAVYTDVLQAEGVDTPGAIWGPAIQLSDLISLISDLEPRKVVLFISPMSVYAPTSEVGEGLKAFLSMDTADPTFDEKFEMAKADVSRRLRARGADERLMWAVFTALNRQLNLERLRRLSPTQWVDFKLSERFDFHRERVVRTIGTHAWGTMWLPVAEPGKTDPFTRKMLSPRTAHKREHELVRLAEAIKGLVHRGWQVVCVRSPVSASVRAIEDRAIHAERLTQVCTEASVPFIDASDEDFSTTDGSHLTWTSGRRFSRALSKMLNEHWERTE